MFQEYDLNETYDNLEEYHSHSIEDEHEEQKDVDVNATSSSIVKILADIPVGIVDLPSPPFKYYDYNEQIKQCIKKLKTIPIGEILIIVGSTNAAGTGKSLFLSVLLRKSDIRSVYSGGIFYINSGETTSEREYKSILRKLIEDLISFCVKSEALSNIQVQKWLTLIRPSYGDVRMEDCLQSLREITSILNFTQHSNSYSSDRPRGTQLRKVLVVLNDVRTDYLPRLLRGCGVTCLVTTRFPDIFCDGHLKGSFFHLEFCPPDQRSRMLELQSDQSIFSSPNSTTSVLNEIFASCKTWGEVDLIARYLNPRYHDASLVTELQTRRKNDFNPGSASSRWVTDHANDNWKTLSLTQHLGSFSTYLMLFDSLCATHKLNYLALSLLPSGVVFPIQFMMMIWGIKIQQDCLDIVNVLCRKGLLSSVTVEDVKLYSLTSLQSHLLILLVLREKQAGTDDCTFLTTFLMCTMFTGLPPPTSTESSAVQSYLNEILATIIKYLTDKKKFATLPTYRLTKYTAYWRRLYTCFHAGILPSFRGALHYFHEVIDSSKNARDNISLFDYIYATTYVIENLDEETETNLKNWLTKGIDMLNLMEASQHMMSNHSASTITVFNQFKIAELRNKLGMFYRIEGRFKEALDLHISALGTFQSSRHPSGSPYYNEIAKTFLYISQVYRAEGALDDAVNVIQSVIQFQQGISTSKGQQNGNVVIAEIWMSLGDLYCNQNKFQDTVQCFRNAIGIYHSCVGNHHPDAVLAEGLLGIVLLKWAQHLATLQENFITSPLRESIEQESVTPSEISFTSSESQSTSEKPLNFQSKRDEGMELTSNAIAWFIRRGYSMASSKLRKLITSLPSEERKLFQNLDGIHGNEVEISSSITSKLAPSSLSTLPSQSSQSLGFYGFSF